MPTGQIRYAHATTPGDVGDIQAARVPLVLAPNEAAQLIAVHYNTAWNGDDTLNETNQFALSHDLSNATTPIVGGIALPTSYGRWFQRKRLFTTVGSMMLIQHKVVRLWGLWVGGDQALLTLASGSAFVTTCEVVYHVFSVDIALKLQLKRNTSFTRQQQ